jgi:hypothetical protein
VPAYRGPSRIVALVGEGKAAGVPQDVRVDALTALDTALVSADLETARESIERAKKTFANFENTRAHYLPSDKQTSSLEPFDISSVLDPRIQTWEREVHRTSRDGRKPMSNV